MRVCFYTLGCKVNQADTASMEEIFRQAGYEIVDFVGQADVYLINTCVVTNTGQRKSRQIINRVVRRHPLSLTVVTGCYPQTAPEEVRAIEGVDVIIGNQERGRIVELVEQALAQKQNEILDNVQKMTVDTQFEELGVGTETDKTRAFLKIQEGCNQYCTYCIIPYARGPLRSRSLASIRTEIKKLVAAGYKEVVLIGIHLGCYGKELAKEGKHITLYDAVQAALSVEGVRRLRLGSLESVEVEPRLLQLMAQEPRLCKHLHLPLQSGCDKILQSMHRPYDTVRFKNLLTDIRRQVPDVAITTDIIVGFPGETEEEFAVTKEYLKRIHFYEMHIFQYSKREGTKAAVMEHQVPEPVKKERSNILLALEKKMSEEFREYYVGKQVTALMEEAYEFEGETYFTGYTKEYVKIAVKSAADLSNQFVKGTIRGRLTDDIYLMVEF